MDLKVTVIRNRGGGFHFIYELDVPRFIANLLAQDYEVSFKVHPQGVELMADADVEGAIWSIRATDRMDRWFNDIKIAVMHWSDCLAELREQIRNHPEEVCLKVSGDGPVHTVKGSDLGNLAEYLLKRGKENGR